MITDYNYLLNEIPYGFWLFFSLSLFTGLIFGSFMNVLVYRLPRNMSPIVPPSACIRCGYKLKYYDNIPILSYLSLKGRCRSCRVKISIRYPLTEVAVGVFFALLYLKYGLHLHFLVFAVFIFMALGAAIADLDTLLDDEFECGIIPDTFSMGGLAAGFVLSYFTIGVIDSFLGAVLGFLVLFLPAWIYGKIIKVEAMGWGDFKLIAMICSFLGYESVVFVLLSSAVLGSLIGIPIILITGRRDFPMPYGPMLSAAGILYLFFGREITGYFRMFLF